MPNRIALTLAAVALIALTSGTALARGAGGHGGGNDGGGGGGGGNPASGPAAYANWRQQWAQQRGQPGASAGWLAGSEYPASQVAVNAARPNG